MANTSQNIPKGYDKAAKKVYAVLCPFWQLFAAWKSLAVFQIIEVHVIAHKPL